MDATLCIPLRYTYLVRPRTGTVLCEKFPESSRDPIWRSVDTIDDNLRSMLEEKYGSGVEITDNLTALRRVVEQIRQGSSQVTARLNEDRCAENTLTVTLHGRPDQVEAARIKVLRAYHQVDLSVIRVEPSIVLRQSQISPYLERVVCDLVDYCGAYIAVLDFVPSGALAPAGPSSVAGDDNKGFFVAIYGDQDCVAWASLKMNVMADRLRGKFVDTLEVPLSLQPLVAGPKMGNIVNIETQTGTRIHFPDWTPELFGSRWSSSSDEEAEVITARNLDEIYVTGSEPRVALARAMLLDVLKRTKPVFKDCVVSFAKVDLLALRYQDKLVSIMCRYGAFVQIPPLGASRSLVRIQGTTSQAVESSIARLMSLTTDFYSANYLIHTGQVDSTNSQHYLQPKVDTDLDEFLDKITAASGAVVYCVDKTSFDLVGFGTDTKRATSMIKSLPVWSQDWHHQVHFKLELSIDQREFIAGKKNGKIVRIMNHSSVFIKFVPFNEYNFYVTLVADDYTAAAAGIQLLEDELPSEISFYIPETYHKQVIGAGGATVQTIMRKYNVFVKFTNDYDTQPNGYCHVRPDNVIIRCPAKNAKNIPPAKQALLDTMAERSQDHCNTFVRISRSHRRLLLAQRCAFIRDIESKTNTIIMLPEREPAQSDQDSDPDHDPDLIEVRGLGASSEEASRMVKALLPEDYVFKIAYSTKFNDIVGAYRNNDEFFQLIVAPLRIALNVETQVIANPKPTADPQQTEQKHHEIMLSYLPEHSVSLEDVVQTLTSFLRAKGLDIIDRGEVHQDPVVAGTAATVGHKRLYKDISEAGSAPDYSTSRSRYDDYDQQQQIHQPYRFERQPEFERSDYPQRRGYYRDWRDDDRDRDRDRDRNYRRRDYY